MGAGQWKSRHSLWSVAKGWMSQASDTQWQAATHTGGNPGGLSARQPVILSPPWSSGCPEGLTDMLLFWSFFSPWHFILELSAAMSSRPLIVSSRAQDGDESSPTHS